MGTISPRGKVLAAYGMREANPSLSSMKIAAAVGVSYKIVWKWLKNPDRFDPHYDHVAIGRAVSGDWTVLESLTVYERPLVIALLERADTDERPVVERFPVQFRDMIGAAVKRRRLKVEQVERAAA